MASSAIQRNNSWLSTREWKVASPIFFDNNYPSATNGTKIEHLEPPDVDFSDQKVLSSQFEQLLPLQEDLAEWINRTIGVDCITGENFLNVLDNGVIVCHLARAIHSKAIAAIDQGLVNCSIPEINRRCWQMAARKSFFARDNMENFIKFCRQLGVHENLLFESDDLVLQNQPRNVILCLLEVARLATKYSVTPPTLVQFEKELAAEEENDVQFRPEIANFRKSDSYGSLDGEENRSKTSSDDISILSTPTSKSEIDIKIQNIKRAVEHNCNCGKNGQCSKLKICKISEGKYNICGKNVFVRLLKGRHMMVRVGGGWDTLEHFLTRHDPCQIKVVTRSSITRSPADSSGPSINNSAKKFLHIHAKYRSPNVHSKNNSHFISLL